MSDDVKLIPGRECGECTVCCTTLTIDEPDIQKRSGLTCRACTGGGCAIYEARPGVCQGFYCAWRKEALFEEFWRPDKSGVFVDLEEFDGEVGFSLSLVGNPLRTVRQPWFIDFISACMTHRSKLSMVLPGPPGYQAGKIPLHTAEMIAAARISRTAIREQLEQALKKLRAYETKPRLIQNSGHDMNPDMSEQA